MKSIYIPKPVPGFQAQIMDGEVVLLHPTLSTIIYLNQTGALIWQLCDGSRSVDEIISLLGAAYPAERRQITQDVPSIIDELLSQGVLLE